jgi:hypothetical protein
MCPEVGTIEPFIVNSAATAETCGSIYALTTLIEQRSAPASIRCLTYVNRLEEQVCRGLFKSSEMSVGQFEEEAI